MLSVKNLVKTYSKDTKNEVVALNNVSIDFPDTGLVFLLGKSGSGKSTLLNAIGGLDAFDSGEIIIKGKSSKDFSQSDFDSYRNTFIGFIFQEYNILENFTVAKNIALAIELQGKKVTTEKVNEILEQVDLLSYAKRKPNQLSGGQKQRVAIARALIKNPEIIMADEPTGALDSNTGKQVMETLKNLSKHKLVIIVSHDRDFAETYGDRIIELKDGKIISDTTKKEVASNKTTSGLSYVKGEYIHIKKGQNLTNKDFDIIIENLLENVDKSDTIIALDGKTNVEIKKIEGISDNGNQKVFSKTLPEDVKQKPSKENFKLIKSKLKFKDSFKLGASALKNKVGKLVFTILLSFFAFTCFGVVDALSTWNKIDSLHNTTITMSDKNISLQKQHKEEYYNSDEFSTNSDIETLEKTFQNYTFLPAVKNSYYSNSIYINDNSVSSTTNGIYQTYISAYTSISQKELNDLGFTLEGRLPKNKNEVCLSKHLMKCITKADKKLTKYQELKIGLPGSSSEKLTVVGLIDSHTDFSKYENITDDQLNNDYMKVNEISQLLRNGYTNLLYVNEELLSTISTDNQEYYNLSVNNTSLYYSICLNELETIEDTSYDIYNYLDYFKGNKQFTSNSDIQLGLNEIIVPKYILSNYSSSSLEDEIDNGLNLDIKKSSDTIKTFKIVGYTDDLYEYIVSSQTVSQLLSLSTSNYDFIFTQLKLTNEDKDLISYCETFNDDDMRFQINCQATSTMQMLEGIINTARSVFIYIAIAFALFASLLLMNYISTSISYKKREIGVLRALGARSVDVFGIFFNESLIIASINFILSTIATFIICSVINSYLILSLGITISLFNASIRQLILIIIVSVASAFISSFIPVMKISRKKPIDAINNR